MVRSMLVTGGASGMGRAAAHLLARNGAAVTVVDRAADPARDVAREISDSGGTARAVPADVRNEDEVEAAVAAPVGALGGVGGGGRHAGLLPACEPGPAREARPR